MIRFPRALFCAILALTTSSCVDLDPLMHSSQIDSSTWSAVPCADVDQDGCPDILLWSAVNDIEAGDSSDFQSWLLSGRDLQPIYAVERGASVIGTVRTKNPILDGVLVMDTPVMSWTSKPTESVDSRYVLLSGKSPEPLVLDEAWQAAHAGVAPSDDPAPVVRSWRFVDLVNIDADYPQRDHVDWRERVHDYACDSQFAGSQRLMPLAEELAGIYPDLRGIAACGDADGDGVLDWLGISSDQTRVLILSGRDERVLQTLTMRNQQLGTVATGGFETGDVDGDGIVDWILGAHVSQSADHETPRTCRLGLLSLVSGGDWHVIRTLERKSFLAGPGGQCPVVVLPQRARS